MNNIEILTLIQTILEGQPDRNTWTEAVELSKFKLTDTEIAEAIRKIEVNKNTARIRQALDRVKTIEELTPTIMKMMEEGVDLPGIFSSYKHYLSFRGQRVEKGQENVVKWLASLSLSDITRIKDTLLTKTPPSP